MSDRAENAGAIEGGTRAAEEVVRIVDEAVRGRALVLGSLPPDGRDVDLLVDEGDAERIGSAFRGAGLAGRGDAWALFRGCAAVGVELARAPSMALPDRELAALYAEGVPLAGTARIVEPAPHHALLILARRLSGARRLEPKHRGRIGRTLARDPDAWERARDRAPAWSAAAQLAALERLYREPAGSAPAHRARRLRWTRAFALAGAAEEDVALHARALRDALHRLGYETALVDARPAAALPGPSQAFARLRSALALWRRSLAHLGRVDVVVFEGHAADHAVSVGGGQPASAERCARLLRRWAPEPRRIYLLDRADDAADGMPEAYRAAGAALGALRVEANLSAGARCELVAKDSWAALARRGRLEAAVRGLTSRRT